MSKNKKNQGGMVYSTNDDFDFNTDDETQETLSNSDQKLYVRTDRLKGNKVVTVVEGFIGSDEDIKALGKLLKSKCGVGGSVKSGEVMIQGDFKSKVYELLETDGYKVKKKGG